MQVELGGNDFFGVPFPLVLADRFFHIYNQGNGFKLDVFRWDEQAQQAIYEVKGSEPKTQNIETNPTGIITFSRENDGTFLYKFRPKIGVSQVFGKIPINEEFEIKINDRAIAINRSNVTVVTFQKNTVIGCPIGVRVEADGSIGMGVNWLPTGMKLIRTTGKS